MASGLGSSQSARPLRSRISEAAATADFHLPVNRLKTLAADREVEPVRAIARLAEVNPALVNG